MDTVVICPNYDYFYLYLTKIDPNAWFFVVEVLFEGLFPPETPPADAQYFFDT